ncbi:MAG: hypothetical protein BRC43_07365, partial [Cyanobacteria bacterium QS_3_48_167]
HQLFDGKHSWKVSTLFQDLQPTPSQVLTQQRRGKWALSRGFATRGWYLASDAYPVPTPSGSP